MIDKWLYNFFALIDKMFSLIETYSVNFSSWLWNKRKNLLKRKRRKYGKRM